MENVSTILSNTVGFSIYPILIDTDKIDKRMARVLNSSSAYMIKARATTKLRKPEERLAHKNVSNNNQSNWRANNAEESDENAVILFQNIIDYCVDEFRIKNIQIKRNALKWVQNFYSHGFARSIGKWVLCLKAVTEACKQHHYIFSQSQMLYFLTLSTRDVNHEEIGSDLVGDTSLKIYTDILDNYPNLPDSVKLIYPAIIVDVVSILHTGMDTTGKETEIDSVIPYLQARKNRASG